MELVIDFPGGARVDAHFGPYDVPTDQPPQGGGSGSAPTPYAVFLSSMGTCAGIFVLGFCKQRGLPVEGIKIVQRVDRNPLTGLASDVELEIQVPESFPDKYHAALVKSAEQCLVKKQFESPPKFNIHTEVK
ncbi:MAG: osmotically inducible protein OsmC [Chloroflexi bacterium]|jgi:putative redox protein|nr:osmotically inducible protein OsmC [Chloroflexota bacterium]MBT4002560.1 osmotically inducible protein OsmC [Chloroflexota bacterium]MBT4305826.1 osmotically inducible protein OsmC [Chloroflexota bacterium]MBT4533650.1 osmotically inducible protein OsmC [Chloroflexota bacterium]MBT4681707.1 osmotically inducible protein OsmC [Chloroflexota bacterium]